MKRQATQSATKQERERADILLSDLGLVTKVQKLIDLGVEEKAAHDLVEQYQLGQVNPLEPVYYERLDPASSRVFR